MVTLILAAGFITVLLISLKDDLLKIIEMFHPVRWNISILGSVCLQWILLTSLTSFFCQANVELPVCDIILADQRAVFCDTMYFCVAPLIRHLAGPWRERNGYLYRDCLGRGESKIRCRDGVKQKKLNLKLAKVKGINVADESQMR